MARRYKKRTARAEIGSALTLLAGAAGWVGGIYLLDALNIEIAPEDQLWPSLILCVVAMAATGFVYSRLFPQPRIEVSFDFDQSPANKHQAATAFEHEVAGLIHQLTGKRTEVVGGTGDGGIDIKVYEADKRLIGIVQCKHLRPEKWVPPAHIRELNTVRHMHQVNVAYLVSTGRFSENSRVLAKQLGVRLIDGQALKTLRKKNGHET